MPIRRYLENNGRVDTDNTSVRKPEIHKSYKFQPYFIDNGGNLEDNIKQAEREKRTEELKRRFGIADRRNPFNGLNKTFGTAIALANLLYGGGWAATRLLNGNKASNLGQTLSKYVLPSNTLDNVADAIQFVASPTISGALDLGTGIVLGKYKDFGKPTRQVGELVGQGFNINNMIE